jgi:hypothetical protein
MALIPANAKVRFTSGVTESEGEIAFPGWGINEINTTQDLQIGTEINATTARLTVKTSIRPPTKFFAALAWPNSSQPLQIELPFPSTGGRFSTVSGEVLPNQTTLPLRRLHDVHLQVYDRNPDAPKRYSLSIELHGGTQAQAKNHQHVDLIVPLNSQGFGEIRLFEIEANLYDLLCQSDSLDAKLTLSLCIGQSPLRKLHFTRYDVQLERESDSFSLSSETLDAVSLEATLGLRLRAVPLLEPHGQDMELAQILSEGTPTGRWNAGQLTHEHAPWLLYPAEDSSLQVRPTIFTTTGFDGLSVLTKDACPLSIAMSTTTQRDRDRMIRLVVAEMSKNFEHKSWDLVLHQHRILGHLPLATMDYWRAFGQSHEASVAVVLKLVGNIPALMQRMRNELGVIWELTPNAVLSKALKNLSESISKQLTLEIGSTLHKSLVADLFRKMGLGSNSLATQIDLALFQGDFGIGNHLSNLLEASKKPARAVLQSLWMGEDSMLQRILLRTHSDEKKWPQFGFVKSLVEALMEKCDKQTSDYLVRFGKELIWLPASISTGPSIKNDKEDVANVPFLTALLVQLTGTSDWLYETNRMAQLRQIRAFDPDWFEVAVQAGGLFAALKDVHIDHKPNVQRAPRP